MLIFCEQSDKELRALKSEIKGLKSAANTKDADLEEAQEELEKLRTETREKDKAIRKEGRELEALKDQLTNLQVRIASCLRSFVHSSCSAGGKPRAARKERAYHDQGARLSPASEGSCRE